MRLEGKEYIVRDGDGCISASTSDARTDARLARAAQWAGSS